MHPYRVLAWLLISAACGLAGCKTVEQPKVSVYEVLPGKWGWRHDKHAGCDSNPHIISFSEDRKEMTLTYARPAETVIGETMTSRYRILSDSPHLRVLLEGETRRNPATNRLVLWDLVLVTPDQYCWHRADGKPGSCSRRIVRCQAN
jgi:hypothetical protein